jgi:histidinol-phosphate/aromatic aminotransferase/cobyric acid decarboxylase-like protein
MFARMRRDLETCLRYYPAPQHEIAGVLAGALGLDRDGLVLGNGSTELIHWIDEILVHDSLAVAIPTFGRWTDDPLARGRRLAVFPLAPDDDFAFDVARFARHVDETRTRVAVVCNPNNPTGTFVPLPQLTWLVDRLATLDLVVIDESFVDFADYDSVPSMAADAQRRQNVLVLKSLGKNFGLHGVRAGYAVTCPALAARLREAIPYWNINSMAELLIRMFDEHRTEYELGRRKVVDDRQALEERLRGVDWLTVYPSRANFVYVRVGGGEGIALRNELLTEHGVFVKECGAKLGADHQNFRIAARPRRDTERLLAALRACAPARGGRSCVRTAG